MRRSILTLLAFLILLSQGNWLEHTYHEHNSDEVCEACLTGHAYDHAIVQTSHHLPIAIADGVTGSSGQLMPANGTVSHYIIRAPPSLSHSSI